jgi:hypothetical protein
VPIEKFSYERRRATRSLEYPEPLVLLGAAFVFWLTHVVCEASVGYVYFARRAGGGGGSWDDWITSTVVDAVFAGWGAVVFAAVPLLIWCTGWMQLRGRVAAIGAACGAAFCVSRWGLWCLFTSKGFAYERPMVEFFVVSFVAALLSVALLKDERRPE